MIRCKLKKYAIILPLCAVFFTMLCTYTYLRFYNYFNSDYAEKLSPKGVFYRVAGNGDFNASGNVACIFIVVFVLFLFYIFTDDNVSYIVRLKSRASLLQEELLIVRYLLFCFHF